MGERHGGVAERRERVGICFCHRESMLRRLLKLSGGFRWNVPSMPGAERGGGDRESSHTHALSGRAGVGGEEEEDKWEEEEAD